MTQALLAELDDAAKYAVEPEAEVFDEHVRYKPDPKTGKPTSEVVKRYTKADLEAFTAGNNLRDKEGCPCAMTIGHTVDDELDKDGRLTRKASEKEQPEIVGYWRKQRVAFSKRKNRWVLMATPYVKRERLEEARTYPRVSAEVWRTRQIVDPIAIIRVTPDRPTQWTFAARTAERYKMAAAEERYRYAMEPPMDDPLDPTAAPDAAAPDQDFQQKFAACMTHDYPHMQAMHEKFAAGLAAPGAMPGPPGAGAGAPPTPETGTMTTVNADQDREKYSALEQENKALKTKLADADREARKVKRRADLEKFAAVVDVDAELADVLELEPEAYGKHLARIDRVSKYAADPAAGGLVNTSGPVAGGKRFGEAELGVATQYMRDHAEELKGLPYDQGWEKAKKFAMTGKAD